VLLGSTPPTALTPRVDALALQAVGGSSAVGGCGNPGNPGLSYQIHNGSAGVLVGSPREITLQSLAYEGSLIAFTAVGAPGERVHVTVSSAPDFQFDPALLGCRLQRFPLLQTSAPLGVIPVSGVLQTQLRMPTLRAGDQAGTFIVQALFVSPGGAAQLGNATAIALADVSVSLN
jgi:hypothetical protein